jgi:hypothetical protein
MFPWLGVGRALLDLALAALRRVERRDVEASGRAKLLVEWLETSKREAAHGQSVRDRVRADVLARPDRLRDDDGFRRSD